MSEETPKAVVVLLTPEQVAEGERLAADRMETGIEALNGAREFLWKSYVNCISYFQEDTPQSDRLADSFEAIDRVLDEMDRARTPRAPRV